MNRKEIMYERLRKAVANACRQLERRRELPDVERRLGPIPGDLYVFDTGVSISVEWLVVRFHPDDQAIVLLAPADDFSLVGQFDVPLEPEFVDRPLTVRCGQAIWVPGTACPEHLRVGSVPDDAVVLVRQKLAALARGKLPPGTVESTVESDSEYGFWIEQVALARAGVGRRV